MCKSRPYSTAFIFAGKRMAAVGSDKRASNSGMDDYLYGPQKTVRRFRADPKVVFLDLWVHRCSGQVHVLCADVDR